MILTSGPMVSALLLPEATCKPVNSLFYTSSTNGMVQIVLSCCPLSNQSCAVMDETLIILQRSTNREFDALNILNPGKICTAKSDWQETKTE